MVIKNGIRRLTEPIGMGDLVSVFRPHASFSWGTLGANVETVIFTNYVKYI